MESRIGIVAWLVSNRSGVAELLSAAVDKNREVDWNSTDGRYYAGVDIVAVGQQGSGESLVEARLIAWRFEAPVSRW